MTCMTRFSEVYSYMKYNSDRKIRDKNVLRHNTQLHAIVTFSQINSFISAHLESPDIFNMGRNEIIDVFQVYRNITIVPISRNGCMYLRFIKLQHMTAEFSF